MEHASLFSDYEETRFFSLLSDAHGTLLKKEKDTLKKKAAKKAKEAAALVGLSGGAPDPNPNDDDEGSKKNNADKDSGKKNNIDNQTKEQLEKSKRAHEKVIKEHEEKLRDYKEDPDKLDNKNLLKGISPRIRELRISGRIEALSKQIKGQKNRLKEIVKRLNELKNKD